MELPNAKSLMRLPVFFATLLLIAATHNGVSASPVSYVIFIFLIAAWLGLGIWRTRLTEGVSLPTGWLPVVILLYLVWIGLNPFFSVLPHASWTQGAVFAALPLVFFAWQGESRGTPDQRWGYTSIALHACGVILALWGIVLFVLEGERAHGPLFDANAYAALINLLLIPLVYEFLRAPKAANASRMWPKTLMLLAITTMLTAQLLTFSRGGFLFLVPSIAIATAILYRARRLRINHLLVLLLVFVATYSITRFVISPPENMIARDLRTIALLVDPQKLTTLTTDQAVNERMLVLSSSWRLLKDGNLFHGSGIGTFKALYPRYRHPDDRTSGGYAHNDYLQALIEGGVILLTFLLILGVIAPVWLLYRTRKTPPSQDVRDSSGLAIGILCVSLHAALNFIFAILPISILLGLYLARCWETLHPSRFCRFPEWVARCTRPVLLRVIVLLMLAPPVISLVADALIAIMIMGNPIKDGLIWRLPLERQLPWLNALTVIRPVHPLPREVLSVYWIDLAKSRGAHEPTERDRYLALAEREIRIVEKLSPIGPSGPLLNARIHMARGTQYDNHAAAGYLFESLRRDPQNVLVRQELTSCLRKIGEDRQAFDIAQGFRPWLLMTTSLATLADLADEALPLARKYGTGDDVWYWSTIRSHLPN